jgi:acyl-CoA thioester hydrolase
MSNEAPNAGRDQRRAHFPYLHSVPSRWEDNDMLRHLNNAIYYSYFQQAFLTFLREEGGLDWFNDPVIPFAAESSCRFWRPLAYPAVVEVGLRVGRIGTSSVVYELALFAPGEDEPAATGRLVHVYVDRHSQRPAPMPDRLRAAYARLQCPA